MGVTFKLYALERKRKKNGEVPIYLRITKNQKYRYVSTGVSLDLKFWNSKSNEVRKSHPKHAVLNLQLQNFVDSVKEKAMKLGPSSQTVFSVKEKIAEDDSVNFFDYAEIFAKTLGSDDNLFESRQTRVLLGQFADYLKSRQIEFADITLKRIYGFREYMAKVLKNKPNTINKKLKRLRRIFKQARKDEIITSDPFSDYESLPSERPDKSRLTLEQINKIAALEFKKQDGLRLTKDAFLFSFYNAGIRFGDLCRLKWKNLVDGYLVYKMSKTETIKKVKLTKPAVAILNEYNSGKNMPDNYIFPLLDDKATKKIVLKQQISSKNALVNKNLKKIAHMAKIQANVTFHVARHSFADYARQINLSIYDISKALGHSDIKITEQYLASFDDHSLDKSMEDMFGKA